MRKIINIIKNLFNFFEDQKYTYKLEEIDTVTGIVKLRLLGKNMVLKFHILDLLDADESINGLSPIDASYLGGYLGKITKKNFHVDYQKKIDCLNFSLQGEKSPLELVSFSRNGEVCYLNRLTNEKMTEFPLEIVNNSSTISNFCAPQAFYLGVLAEMQLKKEKTKEDFYSYQKHPHLKVVK